MAKWVEAKFKLPCNFALLKRKPIKFFNVPVAFKSVVPVCALKLFRVTVSGLKVTFAVEICMGFGRSSEEKIRLSATKLPDVLIRW